MTKDILPTLNFASLPPCSVTFKPCAQFSGKPKIYKCVIKNNVCLIHGGCALRKQMSEHNNMRVKLKRP